MQKINFQNLPNQTTPISAQNLNAIQTNTENAIKEVTNVELLAVTNTPPIECSIGDKYFNTTTKKIYVATDTNTWSVTGEDPISGIFYIVFDEQSSYSWDGTDLVSVGDGSGITVHDNYSESTTEPYSANYVNNNSFSGDYNDLTNKPTIPTLSNTYGTSQSDGFTQDYFNINDFTTYTSSDITLSAGSFTTEDASVTSVRIGLNNDKTIAIFDGMIQFTKSDILCDVSFQTDIRPNKNISLPIVFSRTVSNNMPLLRSAEINTSGLLTIESYDVNSQTQLSFFGYPIMLKAFENIS